MNAFHVQYQNSLQVGFIITKHFSGPKHLVPDAIVKSLQGLTDPQSSSGLLTVR